MLNKYSMSLKISASLFNGMKKKKDWAIRLNIEWRTTHYFNTASLHTLNCQSFKKSDI